MSSETLNNVSFVDRFSTLYNTCKCCAYTRIVSEYFPVKDTIQMNLTCKKCNNSFLISEPTKYESSMWNRLQILVEKCPGKDIKYIKTKIEEYNSECHLCSYSRLYDEFFADEEVFLESISCEDCGRKFNIYELSIVEMLITLTKIVTL